MMIACSTTAFTNLPLEDALSRISALGFSFVDLLMMENWAHINPSELVENPVERAREVAALLRKHRLKAVAINANVSNNLCSGGRDAQDQNMREAEALVAFAREITIPIIVLQPGRAGEDSVEQATARSVAALNEMVSLARGRSTTIAIETHSGSLAEAYQDAITFVSRVPGLKIAYDPSHFVMTKMDLRDSTVLIPHTAHVHLRNAVPGNFQAPMDDGTLDFMWVLEAIDGSGYTGAISIEYLDNRDGDILGDVNELKKLLETRYRHI